MIEAILFVLVWVVFGLFSVSLVLAGHWIAAIAVMVLLLCCTSIKKD